MMEEITWHYEATAETTRNMQSVVIRETVIKPDGKYIVNSSDCQHSSACKSLAGTDENSHQSPVKVHSNQ